MLTMKDFIPEEHEILHQASSTVEFPLSPEIIAQAEAMQTFLRNSQNGELAEKYSLRPGVGVAAPQLGVAQQFFAVYIMDYDEEGQATEPIIDEVFFNPQIISHSVQQAVLQDGEGCLSVNREVPGFVPRSYRVKIKYQDMHGQEREARFKGFEAMVIQHEIDHLKGIMFYDHINPTDPWHRESDWEII